MTFDSILIVGLYIACELIANTTAGDWTTRPSELWERGENWGVLRDPTVQLQGSCADCGAGPFDAETG
jgi:hypothetical protein